MKLRTIIAVFAASVAVAAPAAAEEQVYYCVSELGTAFNKSGQTGSWATLAAPPIRMRIKITGQMRHPADTTPPTKAMEQVLVAFEGDTDEFACTREWSDTFHCASVADFEAATLSFTDQYLITDFRRFELYRGRPSGFVLDTPGGSEVYAGTCETF